MSAARSGLGDIELARAAAGFCERLLEHLVDRTPSTIAGYMAYGGELNPGPALRLLHDRGWTIVLPVIGPAFGLTFSPWIPDETTLVVNRHGIEEPDSDAIAADTIDVVLVPGLAFDVDGGRIGHGAGYYDRFLAGFNERRQPVERVGAAHDLQLVDVVPIEPWDVPMDVVVTPSRIIFVPQPPIIQP